MQDNFPLFFQRVLQDEGTGYEDVPGDNGGPTCCGITIADVARFNGIKLPRRGYPGWNDLVAKVRGLTPATAAPIYKRFYWDKVNADTLPSGLDYTVVDYAVNSGTGRAIPVLGRTVGCPDKSVDDAMLAAITVKGDAETIAAVNAERAAFLTHLADNVPHDAKFKRGWLERVHRVEATSQALAAKQVPAPHPETGVVAMADKPVQPRAMDAEGRAAFAAMGPEIPSRATLLYRSRTATAFSTAIAGLTGKLASGVAVVWGGFESLWSMLPDVVQNAQGQVSAVHQVLEWFSIHSRTLEIAVATAAIISAFAILSSDKQQKAAR